MSHVGKDVEQVLIERLQMNVTSVTYEEKVKKLICSFQIRSRGGGVVIFKREKGCCKEQHKGEMDHGKGGRVQNPRSRIHHRRCRGHIS